MNAFSEHQKKQVEVIDEIERQVRNKSFDASVVSPVDDYEADLRRCLTGIHFPKKTLIEKVQYDLIDPLRKISPKHYYYKGSSLHMTIKNVRISNYPPNFTEADIKKAKRVFDKVVPQHKKFKVYFYRLMLFPNNLALMGMTDPELDEIIFELDKELKRAGIPDDKKYTNKRYFFSNMTLIRFTLPIIDRFRQKVVQLSKSIKFEPYTIDSATLIVSNVSLTKCKRIKTWKLC
jgi:hypothetical protein